MSEIISKKLWIYYMTAGDAQESCDRHSFVTRFAFELTIARYKQKNNPGSLGRGLSNKLLTVRQLGGLTFSIGVVRAKALATGRPRTLD
jgi:hypothetical protein